MSRVLTVILVTWVALPAQAFVFPWDAHVLQAVRTRAAPLVRNCVLRERRNGRTWSGGLDISFYVEPTGRLDGIRQTVREPRGRGPHYSPELRSCIERALRTVRIDPPPRERTERSNIRMLISP